MTNRPKKRNVRVLTHALLLSELAYDKATGEFTWLKGRRAGMVAGSTTKDGIRLFVAGRQYAAHRVAWLYVTGEWPSMLVDHKNNVATDNSFANLRLATKAQNCRNQKAKTNRSGLKGVAWDASRRKWLATIRTDSGRKSLGRFESATEAYAAYCAAADQHHGEFARV